MIIETRFKPSDRVIYLEQENKCSSNKVIKQGTVIAVIATLSGEYNRQIVYKLFDKTEIHETWCYASLEELKEDMSRKIKNLEIGSVIGKI